jgi:hypothetical protein
MLVLCEPVARERTESEHTQLLRDTGFQLERLVRISPRPLIARKQ